MRLASSVPGSACKGCTPKSPWALGLVLAGLLVVGLPSRAVLADTFLNSGTTTVSTATDFGFQLVVATTGNATLEVIAGGYATNTNGFLGHNAGGNGTATVSGGTWANSGNLYVGWHGWQGTGTLNVDGGSVTNTDGVLGYNSGSVGTATVSGGTWANSGDLLVGYYGTGTLTMSGGLVSVAGTLRKSTDSTINLNSGGTLQIGVGGETGRLDVDALTNNGTLIFNRSDAYTHSGIISGSGAVTKQGGGTLTLAGANSYTGLTTVSAGTLALGGVNAIAGSTLDMNTSYSSVVAFTVPGIQTYNVGGLTGSRDLAIGGNTLSVGGNGQSTTYAGSLSGNGALAKAGGGTLTLSGNNSYTGGTTINDGVLALGSLNGVGTFGTISFGGGTLQYSASNTTDYSSRFSTEASQAYEIDTNGQNVTLASPLNSIGGTLTKFGAGTLTLSGNNSYSGGTTISSGSVVVTAGGAIGHSSANLTIGQSSGDSGTLNVTGGRVTNYYGFIGYNAGSNGTATVSSGTWANRFSLYVGDGGTLTMSGGLVSLAGTLQKGTYGTINLNSGGTLQIGVGGETGRLGV